MKAIDLAIKEAKKRGALLGTLEAIDWVITNNLGDIDYVHKMVKKAIKKDEDNNDKN